MGCTDESQTKFIEKLEAFVKPLKPQELAAFKEILERGGMTESEIRIHRPGKLGEISMAARATALDASFFKKLLDW